jgi:hypothetical protein
VPKGGKAEIKKGGVMNIIIEIQILSDQEMTEQMARRLREIFDVVDERDEMGDGDLVRKTLDINAHSSRVNRIEIVIDPIKEG